MGINCFFLTARASMKRSNLPLLFLYSKLNALLDSTLCPHSTRYLTILEDAGWQSFKFIGEFWSIHTFNKPLPNTCNNSGCKWTISPLNAVATATTFKIVYAMRCDIIVPWIRVPFNSQRRCWLGEMYCFSNVHFRSLLLWILMLSPWNVSFKKTRFFDSI